MATIGIEYVREYRPCMVGDRRALFHGWEEKAWTVPDGLAAGSAPGGQVKMSVAIVEYEDGSVDEVAPLQIRFIDGKAKRLCFGDIGPETGGMPDADPGQKGGQRCRQVKK